MCTNGLNKNFRHLRRFYLTAGLILLVLALMVPAATEAAVNCGDGTGGTVPTYTADVVLFDTGMIFNRLGAQNPNWMMYALARDTISVATNNPLTADNLDTLVERNALRGNVALRPDKRPRPLVLRVPADSCLEITFNNLLTPAASPLNAPVDPPGTNCPAGPNQAQCEQLLFNDNQVARRHASVHIAGMQVVNSLADDGTSVGENRTPAENGIVPSGGQTTYTVYAEAEGAFLVSSHGATFGGEATGGNIGVGAFGMVAVQPKGAKIYRSQVTEEELRLATTARVINYEAIYPAVSPWTLEGKAGKPILNMMDGTAIFHSEINAIVAYKDGTGAFTNFPASTYPLESTTDDPDGRQNPSVPNRLEPFRDFASLWHDENAVAQAFPAFFVDDPASPGSGNVTNPLSHALHGVRDSFMINYGSGGIGSEIIANRLGVGPMYDCLDCAYEEFFLTSFTVGDPAMLVDIPANVGLETCNPLVDGAACDAAQIGKKANEAFFPEDPANVHHSYTGDKTKIRMVHAGPKEQHIFHLHNHQWLFNANDDNSNYLDAQGVGPGSSYTYEINYGGSGNRNKTAGDAIFHCHFYPHFAQGMWYLWRHHDVQETGTVLAVTPNDGLGNATGFHADQWDLRSGRPATGARATPDGEIVAGTPIPAVVPIPGKALAPVPARVTIVEKDVDGDFVADSSQVHVDRDDIADVILAGTDGVADTTAGLGDVQVIAVGTTGLDPAAIVVSPGADFVLQTVPAIADEIREGMNPGYPFWIAGLDCGVDNPTAANCPDGIVGQRPPTPLLDMVTVAKATDLVDNDPFYAQFKTGNPKYRNSFINAAGGFDGGLPRHSLEGCKAIAAAEGSSVPATGCSALDPMVGPLTPGGPEVAAYSTSISKLDFHKEVLLSKAVFFPEEGTDVEKRAMAEHAKRDHAGFTLNGGPPVPGAPYNEPCIDDDGKVFYSGVTGNFFDGDRDASNENTGSPAADRSADNPFVYKAANIQIDAVFNKVGYHYPQQRIIALWNDILPTINKTKAPEPFVMRLNTFDCAQYYHSNLVPKEFEVDDYQVRTPTDVIGQHIHLPKWDLTTADGAANGWNYEDGTLSPGMVQERIHAINDGQGGIPNGIGGFTALAPDYPTDGDFPSMEGFPEWNGARVTTQRWFVDPVYNVAGDDRGLGIIFTHDHYGPSTFQQIGLYATLLVEPARSTWKHNETGLELGTRTDGGPTSWQAAIEPTNGGANFEPFREFYLEFSDFQHAYEAGVYVGAGPDGRPTSVATIGHNPDGTNAAFPVVADSFRHALNPSFRQQANCKNVAGSPAECTGSTPFPDIVRFPAVCPDGSPRPCPEAITADDSGMLVVNYRSEPVGLRVFDPTALGPDNNPGTQAAGLAGDLAFALQSREDRAIPEMNLQPANPDALEVGGTSLAGGPFYAPNESGGTTTPTVFSPPINASGVGLGDPYTPMMRVQAGDLVKVKVQSGATEHEHSTSIHGVKWLQSGSGHGAAPNSGWRNAQGNGISEQFTFNAPVNLSPDGKVEAITDHAYSVDVSQDGWWSGMWGIMRVYQDGNATGAGDLHLINEGDVRVANADEFEGACPIAAPDRPYEILAVAANDLLDNQLGVTITGGLPDGADVLHEGADLDPNGGSLIHNPRLSAGAADGPLHDPTALMYVRIEDVEPVNPGLNACRNRPNRPQGVTNPDCPIQLKANAPLEPLVLRANAGDCIKVTLYNRVAPAGEKGVVNPVGDLAGYNTLLQMVLRDRQAEPEAGEPANSVTTFNNNLIRPSSYVGLHPQLVSYDVSTSDGVNVGLNAEEMTAPPGERVEYTWYAGDVRFEPVDKTECPGPKPNRPNQAPCVRAIATAVEFGGSNLIPADKVKQGQKGLIGALVIEPQDSTWPDALDSLTDTERDRQVADNTAIRKTRADVTVDCAESDSVCESFEDLVVMVQKGNNHRHDDGEAVPNIASEGQGIPEDSHDAGQKGVNYGTEPAWFRFGLAPDANFGRGPGEFGARADAWKLYHNTAPQAGEDPATPVYDVVAGAETRMRVLEPTGVGRGTTFTMHGHIWQRDPYLCPDDTTDGIPGKCPSVDPLDMSTDLGLSSPRIGHNPIGMWMGGQESVQPYQHFEIRLENTGGANGIDGDYLWRDQASFGNTDGIWGLMRVEAP